MSDVDTVIVTGLMATVSNKFDAIRDLSEEADLDDSVSQSICNKRKCLPSASSDDSFTSPISKRLNKDLDCSETESASVICTMSNNVDQAIEALNKKMDSLCTSEQMQNLGDEIAKMRSEFGKFKNEINEKIDKFESVIFEVQKRVDNVVKENDDLKKVNVGLLKRITDCEKANNDLEQYTRRENVRVFNLKEEKDETIKNVTDKVCELFTNSLQVKTVPEDLQACHRVGKASPGTERSVIVRFKDRNLRDNVLSERRRLKGSGQTVGEDLTKLNAKLCKDVYKHSATMNSWTINGKVWAKLKNGQKLLVPVGSNLTLFFAEHM